MEQKTTLVVLAAGMGSRFGGLKQMEPFGPNGETIVDYSVFDAKKALKRISESLSAAALKKCSTLTMHFKNSKPSPKATASPKAA